ncbi:MAG: hypothetical protein JJ892_14135 [Balneola sp.]|nr:hypothetical protein [Balneola sp.]MBO6649874.1 hypothetical protein [Balneola sp.]MBO6712438.1 hypothetical protein [Balneola sp.]MBO6801411.1 hypothetical protein [Balneola sp.]MBO6871775.1 hypothetical protein [Balneola sp.]
MKAETKLKKHLSFVAIGTVILLLIPLIAMQFTSEVVWTLSDFVFAGVLLFGTGASFTVVLHKMENNFYRIGAGIALISTLFLVWVNGAVGIVGHEGEQINLLYFIIPAVGLIGAFLSRFRSRGLCYTLCIMAVIPMVIAIIALPGYMQEPPHNSATQILGINMFFTVLFSLSAISFRNAVRDQNENELASE